MAETSLRRAADTKRRIAKDSCAIGIESILGFKTASHERRLWHAVTLAALLAIPVIARAAPPAESPAGSQQAVTGIDSNADACDVDTIGSPYISVDSWVYPAVWRLYSMGFLDTVYLGMRPWTRMSLAHMLNEARSKIENGDDSPSREEAKSIYKSLAYSIRGQIQENCAVQNGHSVFESAYTEERASSGTPLHDSFHLGSTIVNDYSRPDRNGLNSYTGASGFLYSGRFVLYARGEFRGAPSSMGYSSALAENLAAIDGTADYLNTTIPIPYNAQTTIPAGPFGTLTEGRWIEAYVSAHVLNNEVSFGKQDDWLGPGLGGGMAISNNAENIYSFRINRVEPLVVPFLSRFTGPFRYEFLIGPLKGHVYPRDPWMNLEQISFKPSENLEFGFERTVIWGGEGHEPVNLHTFLRSFFSTVNVSDAVKNSSRDPGARFGAFYFSYRLPFVRNWLTLYSDSEAHDDVSPISAPKRASYRPGLYLSHVPGVPKLDVRVEAVSTDPSSSRSNGGQFNYYEAIQRQGFTNSGQILGDWIGREAKGGQAWITYHLSGNEWAQVGVRNQKTPKDFVPGGTTLNDLSFELVKRIGKDLEINGNFTYEQWKAPIYLPGQQTVTTTTVQLTWFPERKVAF